MAMDEPREKQPLTVTKTTAKPRTTDKPTKPAPLPPYRVLLHNDDHNTQQYVTATICQLTPLKWEQAKHRMSEAHFKGVALILTTHKERAELYEEQFRSKGLTVTIEPDK